MNTVEKIVESYYRLCEKCFTIPDVKVINGNNRQIDLLAYNLISKKQYHIEVSVTHCQRWCPTPEVLKNNFDKKFFGVPPKREGKNTDYSKGKTYEQNIFETYMSYGMNHISIQRVWVCWTVSEAEELDNKLSVYSKKKKLTDNIEVVSFRDKIIPNLKEKITTSNYEDDALRTLSLLQQYEQQKET